ncbi:GNAT family N-acetyltransferase [Candidatus Gottesmanbacteria bacterium]|nr:GNAT family N-acetyltransferase [Candidatus Gottesmanbacteria bacterium]
MNAVIRKGTVHDIELLRRINLSSFESNKDFDPHIDMNWAKSDAATAVFTDALTKNGYLVLIAELKGVPVGFLVLSPKHYSYRTVRMIELNILAVLPAYRSKGIGTVLTDYAKQWAKDEGYETMDVSVYTKNQRAIHFYERQGFSHIDVTLEIDL